MRVIVLAMAGLLLAGCYESAELLLDQGAAAQPVKTAADWKYQSEGDTYHAKLLPRADGWYDFQEAEVAADGSEATPERRTVLLNYLESQNGADLYILGTWNDDESAYMYGVAVVRPDKSWQLVIPNCDQFSARGHWADEDLNAAVKASSVQPNRQYGCFFNSGMSLRRAMHNLAASDGFWQRAQK